MQLTTSRLSVTVDEPGTTYRGSRFDWSGIASQVVLDNTHSFLSQESGGGYVGTAGIGLCTEFGTTTPVGYNDAAVGARFPKIGIGRLTRTSEKAYFFFDPYPIEPFALQVESDGSSATFRMPDCRCGKFHFDYVKTLRAVDDRLTIECSLANKGQEPIVTEEYCHNFLVVDRQPVGPDYRLELPFEIKPADISEPCRVTGRQITLERTPETYFYLTQPAGLPAGPLSWKLTHVPSGAGIEVTEHFTPHGFELWGMAHVISPEFLIWLDVQPGKEWSWKREYRFFARS
jgi:hypothetical protein